MTMNTTYVYKTQTTNAPFSFPLGDVSKTSTAASAILSNATGASHLLCTLASAALTGTTTQQQDIPQQDSHALVPAHGHLVPSDHALVLDHVW